MCVRLALVSPTVICRRAVLIALCVYGRFYGMGSVWGVLIAELNGCAKSVSNVWMHRARRRNATVRDPHFVQRTDYLLEIGTYPRDRTTVMASQKTLFSLCTAVLHSPVLSFYSVFKTRNDTCFVIVVSYQNRTCLSSALLRIAVLACRRSLAVCQICLAISQFVLVSMFVCPSLSVCSCVRSAWISVKPDMIGWYCSSRKATNFGLWAPQALRRGPTRGVT